LAKSFDEVPEKDLELGDAVPDQAEVVDWWDVCTGNCTRMLVSEAILDIAWWDCDIAEWFWELYFVILSRIGGNHV